MAAGEELPAESAPSRTAVTHPKTRLNALLAARLVLLAMMLGQSVSVGVLLLLSLLRFAGIAQGAGTGALSGIVWMVTLLLLCAAALPTVDRLLVANAKASVGPNAVEPLIQLLTGLPLGRARQPIAEALAASLAQMDAAVWKARAPWLARVVQDALRNASSRESRLDRDRVWLLPLLEALARCERTEFLKPVEALAKAAARRRGAQNVARAAETAREALRSAEERHRQASTLLRPAAASDEDGLLRPAGVAMGDAELLRPAMDAGAALRADVAVVADEEKELRPHA